MGRQSGQDLGYFVRVPARRPRPADPASRVVNEGELPLVRGTGPRMSRVMGVLYAVGGIVGGFAVFGLILVASFVFSFMGSTSSGDFAFAVVAGSLVAVAGITISILIFRAWRPPPVLTVTHDEAIVRYPGFSKPFVIPRSLVRAVAIDDTPPQLFHNNKRFPVAGALPDEAFADSLDDYRRPPWEPREAHLPAGTTGPTVPSSRWPQGPLPPGGETNGYLFGNGGTALWVLRVNAEDVPNVAVLFHEPLQSPRAPIGFQISNQCVFFQGGRRIRGFMVRVQNAGSAAAAFGAWGVVRQITSEDVLDEGLRLPKALRGWRAPAYAALMLIPLVIRLLRHHIF